MEEEKNLYPFRLVTLEDKFPWGSEEWALADLGWKDTLVRDGWLTGNTMGEMMETYLDRMVGDDVFEWYGQLFPFAVKTLKINGKSPLLACPSDEIARERYDSLGKEKLWYVVSAKPGASLLLGFKKDADTSTFFEACMAGNPDSMLNIVPIKSGQYFHIPAGVPHAILGEATVVEISESSALDFRLCTWGQRVPEDDDPGIPLNLVEALDFIDYERFPAEKLMGFSMDARHPDDPQNVVRMIGLPQFTVNIIDLADALKIGGEQFDSCISYTVVCGELSVQLPQGEDGKIDYLAVKTGETVLVPAEVEEFFLVPRTAGTVLLETMIEKRPEEDRYINPDVAARLPGEDD